MQPLVLHPPSLTTAQFGQPRFNSAPERLPLNRPWSTNARGSTPRAPLPRQPMSGSPPAEEEPSVTSKEPKEETVATAAVTTEPVTESATATATAPAPAPAPLPTTTAGVASSSVSTATTATAQPLPATCEPVSAQIPPRLGSPHTGSPRLLEAPAYPLPPLESSAPGPTTRSSAQKSTRRTKAHVASACVNCKKKHLGCDPARPCRRCVLAGKASSCVDVTHKKRGRPPLKAEDSSLRAYTAHMDTPAVSAEAQPALPSQRSVMHRATSSRELRPMTDIHGLSDPASGAPMHMTRGGHPHRWSASVFPLTRPMDPSPTMPNAVGRRPFSASGPPTYATPPYPPAFIPITSSFNPMLKPAPLTPGMDRRFPPYTGPSLPPPTSPQQHHHPPGIPYLPYAETPSSSIHHPLSDPRLPPGPREPYLESPLRLPPIHQATASPGPPHHAHRLSDPYPTSWSSSRDGDPREPRSPGFFQRPSSSIFTHTSPHQRSSSQSGPLDPVPRHLGPVELPPPINLAQSSPSESRPPANPITEAETQEQRPVKRRKMALDDMVNG